jgi:hypothetical protein
MMFVIGLEDCESTRDRISFMEERGLVGRLRLPDQTVCQLGLLDIQSIGKNLLQSVECTGSN